MGSRPMTIGRITVKAVIHRDSADVEQSGVYSQTCVAQCP